MIRFLFALSISCLMVASATECPAEWVTVCDGNSCHREWRGPVQRFQANRAYRQQSYGSSGQSGYCRSTGGYVTTYRSYGSSGQMVPYGTNYGNVSQGSQGGYSTPSSAEPAPEKETMTVPTSAKPVTNRKCKNPNCRCTNCKCEDCACGLTIPQAVIDGSQKYRVKLPTMLADFRQERDSFTVPPLVRVPAALLASR